MHGVDRTYRFHGVGADLGLENLQRFEVRYLASELRGVFDRLESWMRVLGYPSEDLFAVKVALREAISNAFRHGNRSDPAKIVRISFQVTPVEVLISVEDQGPGFDQARLPAPVPGADGQALSGRGLVLMQLCTSWMGFDPPGNRVTLCRLRSQPRVRLRAD
jgi:serine/threonine-protein kinase RsbW